MEIERKGNIVLGFADDESELSACDVVYVTKPIPNAHHVPRKVTYQLKTPSSMEEYFSSVPKKRRKNLIRTRNNLSHLSIEVSAPLTKEVFVETKKLYDMNMDAKEQGINLLRSDWYKEDDVGAIIAKDKRIVGALFYKRLEKNEYFPARLSVSYVACDQEYKRQGVLEYLNVLFIEHAIKNNIPMVTQGIDTNLYGGHLSPGLSLYKQSLGFKPEPHPKYGSYYMIIKSYKKFGDTILFYSFNGNSLLANVILSGDAEFQTSRLAVPIRRFRQNKVPALHKN